MEFLNREEFFKGYERAIVLCVYTDRVVALVVRKQNRQALVEARATEPQEGYGEGGTPAQEKIELNCEKALAALPEKIKNGIRDVILFLGGGVGTFYFVQAKGIRNISEKNIAAEEIGALTSKWYGKETKPMPVFHNAPQRFWVNGFSVPNAVGLSGKEIIVDMAVSACDASLEAGIHAFASSSGMRIAGLTDMRAALVAWEPIYDESDSATIIALFEKETSIIFVKQKIIIGIRTAPVGYGILIEKLGAAYGVGREEVKRLADLLKKSALEPQPTEEAKKIAGESSRMLAEAVRAAIAGTHQDYLLPGPIYIAASGNMPLIYDGFLDLQWISGLSFERQTKIIMGAENIFESAILSYLSL